jgi:hypothetical protein
MEAPAKRLAVATMASHPLDLVTVLETDDSFALTLAKSALEDAGIPYVVSGDDPRYIPGFPGAFGVGAIPSGKCSATIQVDRESEAEARALLEPLQPKENQCSDSQES